MKEAPTMVDALIGMGKALLPLVVPGSAAAIQAGEKAIELFDHAKEAFEGKTDLAQLNATRDALERAVNDRVHETADRLRG